MTRDQRAKRFAWWRGFAITLFALTAYIAALSLGGQITAEQSITTYVQR